MVQYREFDDELDNNFLYSELYCFFKDWNSHCGYFQERWCGRAMEYQLDFYFSYYRYRY